MGSPPDGSPFSALPASSWVFSLSTGFVFLYLFFICFKCSRSSVISSGSRFVAVCFELETEMIGRVIIPCKLAIFRAPDVLIAIYAAKLLKGLALFINVLELSVFRAFGRLVDSCLMVVLLVAEFSEIRTKMDLSIDVPTNMQKALLLLCGGCWVVGGVLLATTN